MQSRRLLSPIISVLLVLAAAMAVSLPAVAQESTATVPRLITFNGTLGSATAADESGVVIAPATAPTKVVAVTFSLYSEEAGGAPLWSEVQNVNIDSAGRYTVQLGASQPDGLPMDIFSSVQAHWLGVQPQGSAEQPRVLLVSVPYALKSADAETFGGLPPSAYQLAPSQETSQATASVTGSAAGGSGSSGTDSTKSNPPASGSPGYLPLWKTFTTLGSSVIFQAGTGKIGIGTTTPKSQLDVADSNNNNLGVIHGVTTNDTQLGVSGESLTTVSGVGVGGHTQGAGGIGVFGVHDNASGLGSGVTGLSRSTKGMGVAGLATAPTGSAYGVSGTSASVDGIGVIGQVTASGGEDHASYGVRGQAIDPYGAGGSFLNAAGSGMAVGVVGVSSNSGSGKGVFGIGGGTSKTGAKLAAASTMGVWGDSGSGFGMLATSDDSLAIFAGNNSTTAPAISAFNDAITGPGYALSGVIFSTDQNASAVYGEARPATGATNGVYGVTNSTDGNADGVYGKATASTGGANGVQGITNAPNGYGVWGQANSTDPGTSYGVYGQSVSGDAVHGLFTGVNGSGVVGVANTGGSGFTEGAAGINLATTGPSNGVYGTTASPAGAGGIFENTGGGLSLLARVNANQNSFSVDGAGNGWFNGNLTVKGGGSSVAGTVNINGDLNVNGNLNKLSGSFKIDDPLDPANKYLSHSFVESPDMMNIYNGVVRLDARGEAWVVLPAYFEALNRDFRYQLTSLGSSQPRLYIAREVDGNRFKISGGRANGKVSWQVTGVRHDAWANAHRIPNEEDKPLEKRGTYLYPELHGDKSNQNTNAMLQH